MQQNIPSLISNDKSQENEIHYDENLEFQKVEDDFNIQPVKKLVLFGKPGQVLHKKITYSNMQQVDMLRIRLESQLRSIIQIKDKNIISIHSNQKADLRFRINLPERPCSILAKVAVIGENGKLKEGIEFKLNVQK